MTFSFEKTPEEEAAAKPTVKLTTLGSLPGAVREKDGGRPIAGKYYVATEKVTHPKGDAPGHSVMSVMPNCMETQVLTRYLGS